MSAQYARGAGDNNSILLREDTCLPELLILDEAHSARVSKDITGATKKTQIYKMVEAVASHIPHIILATATPMQKEAGEYHSLLKLLGLPKAWQNERFYKTSLELIGSTEIPSLSDLFNAAKMIISTVENMKPSTRRLSSEQVEILEELMSQKDKDKATIAEFVRDNWKIIRQIIVYLHPAHLLTVRNTRRSLTEMGYKFPKRTLVPISIPDSMEVELFYNTVNRYLTHVCFTVEEILYPDKKISIGFVRVSYQQRVASSLHSFKRSLERRFDKLSSLKENLIQYLNHKNATISNTIDLEDFELDDLLEEGYDDIFNVNFSKIDIDALFRSIDIELTSISPLVERANKLLDSRKDLKIKETIKLANNCLNNKDKVLVFSRYTDTIDAQSRRDLIQIAVNWREEHRPQIT
jgi:hypothetical protein